MKDIEIIKSSEPIERLNEERFIESKTNDFCKALFDFIFSEMIKKRFYSMRIKNSHFFEQRDKSKPCILFANHSCWWDGPIAYLLTRKKLNIPMQMMIEGLYRFPLLRKIGGFSVEKSSAKNSFKALDYSINLLNNSNQALWLYPEGIVRPPDFRPIKFASGISYICQNIDGVNLIPIANKYTFLREDRPEILLEMGKPIILNEKCNDRKELKSFLEEELTKLLENQNKNISQGNLEGYEFIIKTGLCFPKLVEKHYKKILQQLG